MDLKADLREFAGDHGTDLFAVCRPEDLNQAPQGHRPHDIMPTSNSVVVLGIKLLDGELDILPTGREGFLLDSVRQEAFDWHNEIASQELDRIGYLLARHLEKKGFKAYQQRGTSRKGGTDRRFWRGLLSLKHMAVTAGLGVFGHHSLVITPEYGPRVRFTAVITDAEMSPDTPLNTDYCRTCGKPCITFCPPNALREPQDNSLFNIDKFLCAQYSSTKPACSICMKVCPIRGA